MVEDAAKPEDAPQVLEIEGCPPDNLPAVVPAILGAELLIRSLPFERLIAFDQLGHELFRRDGQFDQVQLTPADMQILRAKVAIVTHNHPRDVSFSVRDVNMACAHNISILRAISSKYIHTLTAPTDGWNGTKCADHVFPRGEQVEREVEQEQQTAIDAGILTVQLAEENHKHKIWLRLAPEFGFGYWRMQLPVVSS